MTVCSRITVSLTRSCARTFSRVESSTSSGLVFGYLGYVIVRGIFDRHTIDIVIGLVMALCFAYQFTALLPANGISWQGHVFGLVAGQTMAATNSWPRK